MKSCEPEQGDALCNYLVSVPGGRQGFRSPGKKPSRRPHPLERGQLSSNEFVGIQGEVARRGVFGARGGFYESRVQVVVVLQNPTDRGELVGRRRLAAVLGCFVRLFAR